VGGFHRAACARHRSEDVHNLVWATGYNVTAIPLAASALHTSGVLLSPGLGAVLMAASTVTVVIHARLLNIKR
jgi:Cu2+-exporting ATPase